MRKDFLDPEDRQTSDWRGGYALKNSPHWGWLGKGEVTRGGKLTGWLCTNSLLLDHMSSEPVAWAQNILQSYWDHAFKVLSSNSVSSRIYRHVGNFAGISRRGYYNGVISHSNPRVLAPDLLNRELDSRTSWFHEVSHIHRQSPL
jgi:hypothetical protein